MVVTTLDVVPRSIGFGRVSPGRTWESVAEVAGQVTWVADELRNGHVVTAGSELLRIEDANYRLILAQAEAQLQASEVKQRAAREGLVLAKKNLTLLQTEYSRQERLAAKGTISKNTLESTERQLLAGETQVANLQNALDLSIAEHQVLIAQQSAAKLDLQRTVITAPFDVRIIQVNIGTAQYANRGELLFTADGLALAEVEAQFSVGILRPLIQGVVGDNPSNIGAGATRLNAKVHLRTATHSVEWPARVDRVAGTIDPQTQTIGVIVAINQPYASAIPGQGPPLRRDTFVEVELYSPPIRQQIVIPLTGELPDVAALKFTDKERGIAGKAIDLRIQGSDLAHLKAASTEIQQFLATIKGLSDISDDLRPGKPEFRVQLKEHAGVFGITDQNVANELRAAIYGNSSLEILRGYERYAVTIRLAADNRNSLDDLLSLRVRAADGTLVPLSAIADIERQRGYARIHRINGQRTVTIQASLDTRQANAREVMGLLFKRFLPTLKTTYPDIHFVSQGQDKETAETGNSLQTNLLIGLIGVIWGHLLMGLNLTMPSLVGFATLAGVVVNDNILLVTFLKERLREDTDVKEAGWLAAKDRFRPIMLTSLTTLAGLLPLLMETSTQAQILIPLVASLAFGLLTATIASLFLVPALFTLFDDMQLLPKTELSH